MLRVALATCLLLISSLQVSGLAIQTRDDEPAFLSQSDDALKTKYSGLKKGQLLPQSLQIGYYKYNDEIWFDNKFGTMAQYLREYTVITNENDMVDQLDNPFEGNHPLFKAGRLPGINNDPVLSSYIASQSPIALGKGSTTLYWDIVWMKAKSNALLVDLLESNPRYIAHKGSQAIPTSQDDPLLIYAIEDDTGEMTCTVKYSVNLVKTTSHYDGLIIHYQLRLVEEASRKSKMLNYIHYTSWPNRLVISNEDMTRLIDLVNEVNVAGSTIFVNCQYGLGRTGTFIMSREIYNTAKQSKKSGKNWFTPKGANGADPIEQYVNTLRIFRHDTIDSSRQFLFLYQWTRDLQQKLYG